LLPVAAAMQHPRKERIMLANRKVLLRRLTADLLLLLMPPVASAMQQPCEERIMLASGKGFH
jgi:hypothetical protein